MPRPKRLVRAHGIGKSLGAGRPGLLQCVGGCDRVLPREAIAYLGSRNMKDGPYKGKAEAYCGECWRLNPRKPVKPPLASLHGKRWTDQEILDALVAWARREGRPPTFRDWVSATYEHPTAFTARAHFGSWNRALELAGLTPAPKGTQRPVTPPPAKLRTAAARRAARIAALNEALRRQGEGKK